MNHSILIVKHGPHSHKITELVDNTHLFDRQIMNMFLEQFTYTDNTATSVGGTKTDAPVPDRKERMREARLRKLDHAVYEPPPLPPEPEATPNPIQEHPYTYDDIQSIQTVGYVRDPITDLPAALEKLELHSTYLTVLPTLPLSIRAVTISGSRINTLPDDLSHLVHLVQFKLLYTHLDLDTVVTVFPPSTVIKQITTAERRVVPHHELAINYHKTTDGGNKTNDKSRAKRTILQETTKTTALETGQSVHLPSVNASALNSVRLILQEASKYPRLKDPLADLFYRHPTSLPSDPEVPEVPEVPEGVGEVGEVGIQPNHRTWCELFYYILSCVTIRTPVEMVVQRVAQAVLPPPPGYMAIRRWCLITDVHSLFEMNFATLFELVVRIAKNHPQSADVFERIRTELKDAEGMCFMGRMNRLVNALVGIVDGVYVGVSSREQIQMEIQRVLKKLVDKTLDKEKCQREMEQLFESTDALTPAEQRSYLDALEDWE